MYSVYIVHQWELSYVAYVYLVNQHIRNHEQYICTVTPCKPNGCGDQGDLSEAFTNPSC